ncbi:MAG: DUF819 family protein [Candidatus Sumerlaeia bacterium]|nr:DUF819 family protein [Candidatus Sumerlaeia bacterium]
MPFLRIILLLGTMLLGFFLHPTLCNAEEKNPGVELKALRTALGSSGNLSVKVVNLPEDTKRIVVELTLGNLYTEKMQSGVVLESGMDRFYTVEVQQASEAGNALVILDRRKEMQAQAAAAGVTMVIPTATLNKLGRGSYAAKGEVVSNNGETVHSLPQKTETWAVSYLIAPASVFGLLASVVAGVFLLSTLPALKGFFTYLPPLIWMYFIPMILTTLAIVPDQSPLYSSFFSRIILPATLVLLILPTDVRTIGQLGPRAILVMLIGTVGIVLGAIISFALFNSLFTLPVDSWKGLAGLSGSWIGGSPNMTAVFVSLNAPANIIGPMIILDTVLAYSWLGFLVAMSGHQKRIDAATGASAKIVEELSARLQLEKEGNQRAPKSYDIALMVGLAFGISQICLWLGPMIFNFWEDLGVKRMSEVLSGFAWGILLITAVSLYLSTTRLRHLDYCGASSIGNIGLYLLLTTYGAQADLRSILDAPVFILLGILWILIHIAILFFGAWLLKAPVFLVATGSMANIGGTASAPVVAASYYPSMAPVGLLMAILGGVLGTPVALLIVAPALRWLAGG